jgi:hypothetical protein
VTISFQVLDLFVYLLHRRIEGAPNFRRVPMILRPVHSGSMSPDEESEFVIEGNGKMVCGRSVVVSTNIFGNM